MGDATPSEQDKNANRRAKLREELISTEQSYVHGLNLLQHIYLTAVDVVRKNEADFSALPTDAQALEINLPMLVTLHTSLVKDMQESDPDKLATVISKYAPMMSCYVDYLSRYEAALNVMERLKKKKKFKELMDLVDAKLAEDSGKRLLDYLITPVQRLPRYVMLLAELIRHSSENQPLYAELKEGHAKIQEIAMAVNEGKRKMETMQKLLEIQGLLKDLPADFTWPPHRTLLREGKLKVTLESFSDKSQSLKKLTDRMLYLFSDKLLLAKADNTYHYDVMITSITVESIVETETDFTVSNSKMSVAFRCESADERASWIKDLESTRDTMKKTRTDKTKIKATLKRDTLASRTGTNNTITDALKALSSPRSMASEDKEDDTLHEEESPREPETPMTEERRRDRLREELIATERTYVHGLDMLQICYLTAVDVIRQNEATFSALPTDVAALEINLPMLHKLHHAMLKDMLEVENEVDKIASVISKYGRTFMCYVDYLSRYEAALAVMERLKKKKKFKELMDAVDSQLSAGSGKRLLDYLITPVQRLPRYVMLLAEVIKHTEKDTPLYEELKAGHAKIQEIALAVNEGKRKMESLQKLTELQAQLKDMPADFTWPAHRVLLREGKLQATMESFTEKAQSLKVSDRLLFLFSDKLLLARPDYGYRYDVMISSIMIEAITETDTDFTVTNSKMSVCFRCASADERSSWVTALENAKEAVKETRGNKRLIKKEYKAKTGDLSVTSNLIATELKKLASPSNSSRASIVGDFGDGDEDKKEDPTARRAKVREELIGTLQSCVATLSVLQSAYLAPLEQVKKEPEKFKASANDPTALEFNLPAVIALHQALLRDFKDGNVDTIAAAISKHSPAFSCYGDYLDRYEGALAVMEKLKAQKKFKEVLAVIDKNLKDEGVDKRLVDYLVTPLPKLFQFVKQLTEFIKLTRDPTQSVDLKAGYAKIHEIAMRVNEGKTRMEARTRVLEVQAVLKDMPSGFVWPPNRVLIRQGKLKSVMETFSKKSQSLKASDRIMYLFSDKVIVTRADNAYRYDANTSSITVEAIAETETDFTMSNSTMSACFRCENAAERDLWVQELDAAKEHEKDARGSQRQLVRQKNEGGVARVATTTMISEELQKLSRSSRSSHLGEDED